MSVASWMTVPFEQLVEFHDRRRIPLSKQERHQRPGTFPYYGAQGIIDSIDDYIFDGRFLLIAEDGENLRSRKEPIAFIADGKFWVNNHAHVVRAIDKKADADFLRAYLEFHPLKGFVTGAAQPKLSQSNLKSLPVTVPPFDLQFKIGERVRAVDGLIEQIGRQIHILEKTAQLLYDQRFTCFLFPGHEKFELVASELGPIPKGWAISSLGAEIELKRQNIKPYESADEVFDHYSIPAFDAHRRPKVEAGSDIRSGKYLLSGQSILVSKLNPRLPRIWRADVTNGSRRAVASTEFLVLSEPMRWPLAFIYGLVSSTGFTSALASTAGGTSTSHQRVKPADVMATAIVDPPSELVANYARAVEPILAMADVLLRQVEVLRESRDLLLPRLVSGELDISDSDLEAVGV